MKVELGKHSHSIYVYHNHNDDGATIKIFENIDDLTAHPISVFVLTKAELLSLIESLSQDINPKRSDSEKKYIIDSRNHHIIELVNIGIQAINEGYAL